MTTKCAVYRISFECPVVCVRVDVNPFHSFLQYKFKRIQKLVVLCVKHSLFEDIVHVTPVQSYELLVRIHNAKSDLLKQD